MRARGRAVDGGCLAAAWFDGVLLAGAGALAFPIASLAALACPSGGPGCGPGFALLGMFGAAAGLAVVFTVLVLGLGWLARRWSAAVVAMAVLGVAMLAIPLVALVRAVLVGDSWLTFAVSAVLLIVPGVAILADVRALLSRRPPASPPS